MTQSNEYLRCLNLLNEEEIVGFLSDLIKVESYPPAFNEKDVAVVVAQKLKEYGIESVIEDLDEPNRANLIAGIGSKKRPNLVYGGHFDTVPPVDQGWKYGPFDATIEDGIVYGRGACDMKGGVAAMIMAMCYLKKAGIELNGRLTFLGTAGEEVGCYGAKAYNKKYGCEDIDALAISEATNKLMSLGEKGALWIKFITRGRAAHPGVSWEGVNSLLNMLKFFEVFRKYEFSVKNHEFFGAPTLNITTMHAGDITNALPIKCEATVDIRTVPGVSHQDIIKYVESIIADMKAKDKDFVMEYEIINDIKLIETDKNSLLVKTAFATHEEVLGRPAEPTGVFYFTDAIALERDNPIPLIIYGPGNPKNNHKVNEPVPISELIDVTKFYIALAINYLK